MEEQLTLYVRYTAKDGCREAFVREIVEAGILTLIRQEPGCLAYDYYFSAQDENELLLIERGQSAGHQRIHMQQHFREDDGSGGNDIAARSILGPLLPPAMIRLREIKNKYIADTKLGRVRLED